MELEEVYYEFSQRFGDLYGRLDQGIKTIRQLSGEVRELTTQKANEIVQKFIEDVFLQCRSMFDSSEPSRKHRGSQALRSTPPEEPHPRQPFEPTRLQELSQEPARLESVVSTTVGSNMARNILQVGDSFKIPKGFEHIMTGSKSDSGHTR